MNHLAFIGQFIKDYKVGAISKSSPATIGKVCAGIDFSRDITVVEYGPGDGTITKVMLGKMTPRSRIIAIETNRAFIRHLAKISDPRLIISAGRAQDVAGILEKLAVTRPEYVISGIPFSFLPKRDRKHIAEQTYRILDTNGKFIVYQYTPAMAKRLKKIFGNIQISFVPLNLPSYFVMESKKQK